LKAERFLKMRTGSGVRQLAAIGLAGPGYEVQLQTDRVGHVGYGRHLGNGYPPIRVTDGRARAALEAVVRLRPEGRIKGNLARDAPDGQLPEKLERYGLAGGSRFPAGLTAPLE
jgi:hypothetical protein